MGKAKQQQRRKRQLELLKLFDGDCYEEKLINNQWFVKQWNGNNETWQVGVYSVESFRKYKQYAEKYLSEAGQQRQHLKSIMNETGTEPDPSADPEAENGVLFPKT